MEQRREGDRERWQGGEKGEVAKLWLFGKIMQGQGANDEGCKNREERTASRDN